jgi:hypothetical protein
MGLVIKKTALPYKSLIFNYKNLDNSTILYNDTNLNWTILSSGTGSIDIVNPSTLIDQTYYCVIVTPIRLTNNHSICVLQKLTPDYGLKLTCCENGNNILTDDGFDNMTVQINFFNL